MRGWNMLARRSWK